MSLPQLNPVEPPWYGPVCPVVGEGWHREVSPYPDLGWRADHPVSMPTVSYAPKAVIGESDPNRFEPKDVLHRLRNRQRYCGLMSAASELRKGIAPNRYGAVR